MPEALDLTGIETATLGHFLTDGFLSPAIQCIQPTARIAGPALTVRLPGDDDAALTDALSVVEPGQIIVVDRCGDMRHACWGTVTTHAAMSRGAACAIVDGFITDISVILELGFPVWCRGRSPITTRNRGFGGEVGGVVSCGRAQVKPGDIVLADENGVAVLSKNTAGMHCARAREIQDAEAVMIRQLYAGQTLADLRQDHTATSANQRQPLNSTPTEKGA